MTRQIRQTWQTRLTRQIFPPDRIWEGWCENCQTIKIANVQFRSVSQIRSSVQEMLAYLKVASFTKLHNVLKDGAKKKCPDWSLWWHINEYWTIKMVIDNHCPWFAERTRGNWKEEQWSRGVFFSPNFYFCTFPQPWQRPCIRELDAFFV